MNRRAFLTRLAAAVIVPTAYLASKGVGWAARAEKGLKDYIYWVDPAETPFASMMRAGHTFLRHEWGHEKIEPIDDDLVYIIEEGDGSHG